MSPALEETAIMMLDALLGIRGPSGWEARVAAFVRARLLEAGIAADAIRDDGAAARLPEPVSCGNLVVDAAEGTAPRRMFVAHLDTVPGAEGVQFEIDGDRIVVAEGGALGGDDRCGVAAILAAFVWLRDQGRPLRPLRFLFTICEEAGVLGARHVDPEVLVGVGEAFSFDGKRVEEVVVASPGSDRMEVHLRGVASHAGTRPQEGASALVAASLALARLARDGWHGRIERDGEWLATANVGRIEGGEATNVVAAATTVSAEARSHEPAVLAEVVEAWRRAFEEEAAAVTTSDGRPVEVDFSTWAAYHPFDLGDGGPAMEALARALAPEGLTPEPQRIFGGLDASWLVRHGVPTLTLGCGYRFNHTPREEISVPHYLQAVRVAARLMAP
jgi:tripeptide aminopeptidase